MDTRLRYGAEPGGEPEEPDALPARAMGRRSPSARRLEDVAVVAMVPAGIFLGALLALAFVVRLLMLPFRLAARSASEREYMNR